MKCVVKLGLFDTGGKEFLSEQFITADNGKIDFQIVFFDLFVVCGY